MSHFSRGDASAWELMPALHELAAARDVSAVVRILQRATRELSRADGATVALREAEHCHFVDEDGISPLWQGQRLPLRACAAGWAIERAESVVIEDIFADPRVLHEAYRPTFVKSLAMVPVPAVDPIAAIGAYWARPRRATPGQLDLLRALASAAAVALRSVGLAEELEGRTRESAELVARLRLEVARREDLEARLRDARKMETLGLVARGHAHELGDLLTAIDSHGSLAPEASPDSRAAREDFEQSEAGCSAELLTRRLPAFGRKQAGRPSTVVCNDVVRELEPLSRRTSPENVRIETQLAPDLPRETSERSNLPQRADGILVVEPDDVVRKLVRRILEERGYAVYATASAAEAERTCHRFRQSVRLLITDVALPRVDGRTLAERLGAMQPDLSVLYVRGRGDEAAASELPSAWAAFDRQPLTPAALLAQVQRLLDEANSR